MSAPSQTASLLVLSSQANEAERLITSLRNGGLPVRGMYGANADRIDDLVERRACDLIICCAYDPELDLRAIQARHRELDDDVPLIVIADHRSEPHAMIQALRAGARDVTERDDQEHLQLVVARELADLRQRRQLRQVSRQLEQCEQRSRDLIESTGEAVAFVQDGLHVHANPAYLELFRFPGLDDLQAATFLDLVSPEQRQLVRDFLRRQETGEPGAARGFATTCVRADGSRFQAELSVAASELDGDACLRMTMREALDPDTQGDGAGQAPSPGSGADTPGYEALIAAIQERIGSDRRAERPFALFFVQVPSADSILRTRGLSRGRSLLGALLRPLAGIVADLGKAFPIGDRGFGLLVDDADEALAQSLAGRIRSEVRLSRSKDAAEDGAPDCELGFILVSGPTVPAMDLIDEAYRACIGTQIAPVVTAGQHQVTSLAARTKQSAELGDGETAAKVEYALTNERFLLVYQPIISLMGDNQENYSVLLRLIDEDENLLEARDFIGAAIRLGMIDRLDRWAIRHAIQAIGEHRGAGHNLNFFINLAEDTFRDPGIIIWICDCLREFDVRGSWLTFVFQEELVESNLASLTKLVEGLKKIKCRVAVNRFGATNRPQSIFQGLPLDFVLLLPDFAHALADDKEKQKQLLALAELAREYNVKSIVTGVEDAHSLTILWTAGVDYVQGNFLQRPSPTLEMAT